jgi:5-methylcytosine-specific restriction endonuclease McrA
MRNEVLLLNADVAPVNWLPLSTISWQNAVRLIWLDVVEVLHTYEDRFVHSPSLTIEVPSVVMLRKQVKGFRNWVAHEDSPPAYLVFLRDNFLCQYCLKQFPRHDLTIDHVKPKCFGGRTTWSNATSACSPCNSARGCNYRILPATKPYLPTMNQLVKNMRKFPISVPHPAWNLYLKWEEKRLHLIGEDNVRVLNHFDIDADSTIEYYPI